MGLTKKLFVWLRFLKELFFGGIPEQLNIFPSSHLLRLLVHNIIICTKHNYILVNHAVVGYSRWINTPDTSVRGY